jgi:ATP-dependent Lon protease
VIAWRLAASGYRSRKANIAKQYLVPRQVHENGLDPERFTITDSAITLLATRYTREAGVRQIERTIGRIARKAALKVAEGATDHVTVDAADVRQYIGPPRFYPEEARKELPAGVATGMAWTEMGGEVLFTRQR